MPKISVIVPVYNVEKYLKRCVDSILNQTFTDFELILVDDGSPDNCGKICDEYADKDMRVIVIHKQNGGVSEARNKGIEFAVTNSGSEFITFVDSDDYVHEKYLEFLSERDEFDLSVCGVVRFNNEGLIIPPRKREQKLISQPFSYYNIYKTNNMFSPYNKLFRANILKDNNIRFPNTFSWGEDGIFVAKYLIYVKKICILEYAGYYYFENGCGSLSTKIRCDIIDEISQSRLECLCITKSTNNCEDFHDFQEYIYNDIKLNCSIFVIKLFHNRKIPIAKALKILKRFLANEFTTETFATPEKYYKDKLVLRSLKFKSPFLKLLSYRTFALIFLTKNKIKNLKYKLENLLHKRKNDT